MDPSIEQVRQRTDQLHRLAGGIRLERELRSAPAVVMPVVVGVAPTAAPERACRDGACSPAATSAGRAG